MLRKKRSSSRVKHKTKILSKPTQLMTTMFEKVSKDPSPSSIRLVIVVERQRIEDRFGDGPKK
jgi:hypothetical protein